VAGIDLEELKITPQEMQDLVGKGTDWDVTAAIPTIPPRVKNGLLDRAIRSVHAQTMPVAAISVAVDVHREGAPATRQRALDGVGTSLVAFLDDDDEWLPQHVDHLVRHMRQTDADVVYSWFKVVAGGKVLDYDPVFPPTHYAEPFDPRHPIEITSTILAKTKIARLVGFRREADRFYNTGEDWRFVKECLRLGAKISHLVEHTWLWHHDSKNTSGLPENW
jgi:Glycosyl transferase family 2